MPGNRFVDDEADHDEGEGEDIEEEVRHARLRVSKSFVS